MLVYLCEIFGLLFIDILIFICACVKRYREPQLVNICRLLNEVMLLFIKSIAGNEEIFIIHFNLAY